MHLRPEDRSRAWGAHDREHGGLDAHLGWLRLRWQPELVEPRARRDPARRVDEVDSGRLAHERDRPGSARIRLEDIDGSVRDSELDVEQTDGSEFRAERTHDLHDLGLDARIEIGSGQDARGVAGMDPGLLHMFHHPADVRTGAVADGIDIHLDGILEETVDEDEAGCAA